MSRKRLEYGVTGVNPVTCLEGDFDGDGSFTLNDAAWVAEVRFNLAKFPWHTRRRAAQQAAPQRERASLTGGPHTCMSIAKESAALQVGVYVSRADTSSASVEPRWKALSVQFAGGKIASVQMHHGTPGQITAQHAGSFFQAAELGGGGLDWPTGLAATVTFEADTDMDAVHIDYESMNTYIVQHEDHECVQSRGASCRVSAVYFRRDQEHGCRL